MAAKKKPTTSLVEFARPNIDTAAATARVSALCRQIDNKESPVPIDAAVIAEFKDARMVEQAGIDEAIAFKTFLDGYYIQALNVAEEWRAKAAQIAKIHETFDEKVIKPIIAQDPDRIYMGSIGILAVHKNPPSLKTSWGSTSLDPGIIQAFGVGEEWYDVIPPPPTPPPTYKLKTQAVKDAILKHKMKLDWAVTEQATKVVVTK